MAADSQVSLENEKGMSMRKKSKTVASEEEQDYAAALSSPWETGWSESGSATVETLKLASPS